MRLSSARADEFHRGLLQLTPLQLAEKVIELQNLGELNATICRRLNITEQTIRDVLLLANAPAALHKLIRDKVFVHIDKDAVFDPSRERPRPEG